MNTISGQEVLTILSDFAKRGADTVKLEAVYSQLRALTNGDFTEQQAQKAVGIIQKIETAERNLAEEVREWIDFAADGVFAIGDIMQSLRLSGRLDEQNVSQILRRLVSEEKIERTGERRGVFRPIESVCERIMLTEDVSPGVDIKYPFGLERLVKTYPKNIVVVAGEPDAGKTAFLLNLAYLNRAKRVCYFSSEMGKDELVARCKKFNQPLEQWSTEFFDRAGDFHDVIQPDDINIIDFLEIHEEFWKVGSMIKKIYDKINNGIAVIALQKNRLKKDKAGNISGEFGLGGYRGVEKARLYLTMGHYKESHYVKIMKGKNWKKVDFNPNNLVKTFKLIAGCNFHQECDWNKLDLTKNSDPDFTHEE